MGFGATTKGGTKIRLDLGKSESKGNYYFPDRTEKVQLFLLVKQFNTGGWRFKLTVKVL